jgi:fucose permease
MRLGVAFFGFALIGANGGAVGVVLPSLSIYYHVDKSVVGLLFLTSSVGYFLSAFSSSLLLEKLGQRAFLIVGASTFLLGTLTLGIKPPFVIVLSTRLFLGFGMAIIETGLNAYVVALPRHTSLLNTLHGFYGAGALVGPVVAAALLALQWGWNSVYLTWCLLSLPLLIRFAVVFSPQLPRSASREVDETRPGNVLIAASRLPVVWWASLFLLLYGGVNLACIALFLRLSCLTATPTQTTALTLDFKCYDTAPQGDFMSLAAAHKGEYAFKRPQAQP